MNTRRLRAMLLFGAALAVIFLIAYAVFGQNEPERRKYYAKLSISVVLKNPDDEAALKTWLDKALASAPQETRAMDKRWIPASAIAAAKGPRRKKISLVGRDSLLFMCSADKIDPAVFYRIQDHFLPILDEDFVLHAQVNGNFRNIPVSVGR